ncbi:MAG: N-acetyltransferase [Phycisphaerales bacterium]|nr:N-acetyltransferase [Phycisphaerales bacterium]
MRTRLATDADIPAIAELINGAITGSVAHFGTSPEPPEAVREQWLARRDRYAWLVAEIDARFAGFARAAPWKTRGAYDWTVELGIYIHPASQGRGVGKGLYTKLIEVCREQGYCTALAGVALPNEASEALHRSVGMQEAGTIPRVGHKHGRWIDSRLYTMTLAETPGPIIGPEEAILRLETSQVR